MKSSEHEASSRIWKKTEKIRVAMVTLMESGTLVSRPMTMQEIEAGQTIWFFAGRDSRLVQNIGNEAPVNVSVVDHDDSLFVSVAGRARLVEDKAKAKALFNAFALAWFPGGANDANLALVKVEIESAEYWDSDHGRMMQLMMMAKAAVTGHPPTGIGEHRALDADPE